MLNCLYAGMNYRPHPPIVCIAVQCVHQKDTKWILPSHLSMLLGVGFVKGIVEMWTTLSTSVPIGRVGIGARPLADAPRHTQLSTANQQLARQSSADEAKQSVLSGISTVGTFIG